MTGLTSHRFTRKLRGYMRKVGCLSRCRPPVTQVHLASTGLDQSRGAATHARSVFLAMILLGACGDSAATIDASARPDSTASAPRFGGSYLGPATLELEAARVRSQGGHVVVANFGATEGGARPETIFYSDGYYRGERSRVVARYTVADPLGEPLRGEIRVDGLLTGERIVGPDGYVYLDENNVAFIRDHVLHPASGNYVLFLVPSRTTGIWWLSWRASINGATVSGDHTAIGSDGSRRGDVPLAVLRVR